MIAATLLAAATAYGPYAATVVRVLDGDTLDVTIAIAPQLTQHTRIRLHGVNAPETRTRDACEKAAGLAAKRYVAELLDQAETITVSNVRPGKYANRMLGTVTVDGLDLTALLIESGHGRPYAGGRRDPWCQH